MKNLNIILFLAIILYGCTSNNNSINLPSIDGATFVQTSYVLETTFDINGDGVFSNDIYEEMNCGTDTIRFNTGEKVWNPSHSIITLNVTDDGTGNLSQTAACGHFDGILPNYSQRDEFVDFYYNEEIIFTGTISDNGNTITFDFPNELLYVFVTGNAFTSNEILNPDDSITQYEGGAIVTYTRQ
tara:strand:+ start:6466 stop:7020 length:555 start_codon:yes stop_codon:yes gene_type:complete